MDPTTKYEYTSEASGYHANYMRNSKAIGVLWGVFTICFAIINAVVFIQPQWIGDTPESRGTGYFGLWQSCRQSIQDGQELVCHGRLDDFASIPSPAFKMATIFIGLSAVAIVLCILCMFLFFVCHSSTVFHICGWLQVLSGACMIAGVVSFPAGWDSDAVRDVCGPEADDYDIGQCGVRWAYILATIGIFDAVILAALAFLLATRYVKITPSEPLVPNGSIYKGEVNSAFLADTQSLASRKSLALQPVMLMPQPRDPERISEFSQRTGRSKASHYTSSVHNFQL
ncbi:LHFPL tetraspan subfamily member 3 protein like [Argiope bruennichi]|uniref:LHFPL tetraspan subfamily member 3 protein like n=2 Tax=Argiope bruennichi TaxID=94029 RepID=A0A8T0EH53_ARGBR|nr:LHFPL tetraspan subfamily member 3 protein like [Argiope bruennichi]